MTIKLYTPICLRYILPWLFSTQYKTGGEKHGNFENGVHPSSVEMQIAGKFLSECNEKKEQKSVMSVITNRNEQGTWQSCTLNSKVSQGGAQGYRINSFQ